MMNQRGDWSSIEKAAIETHDKKRISNEKQKNEKEKRAPWTQLTLRLQQTLNTLF